MMPESQRPEDERSIGERVAFLVVDAVEELNLAPRDSWWNRIIGGYIGPTIVAIWGIRIIVAQRAAIYNPFFKIMGHPTMIAIGIPARVLRGQGSSFDN